jgi:hypothetical protein
MRVACPPQGRKGHLSAGCQEAQSGARVTSLYDSGLRLKPLFMRDCGILASPDCGGAHPPQVTLATLSDLDRIEQRNEEERMRNEHDEQHNTPTWLERLHEVEAERVRQELVDFGVDPSDPTLTVASEAIAEQRLLARGS